MFLVISADCSASDETTNIEYEIAFCISPSVAFDLTLKSIFNKSVSAVIPLLKSITSLTSLLLVGFPLNPTYAFVEGILLTFALVKSSTDSSSFPIVTFPFESF